MAPPPPNTPNQSNLEDEIIKEAQRQEMMLKEHMEKKILNFADENQDEISTDSSGVNHDIQTYDPTVPTGKFDFNKNFLKLLNPG